VAVELHAKPRRLVELRFTDAQGRPTDIAAFRGRVVLLNIWATWCAPCREELPTLDALQAQLGGPGFEVIALSIDQQGLAVARPFLERIGATHLKPYADTYGEATARYSATGVPLVLVIDARGREIGRRLGRATWDNAATVALMRSLIAATKRPIPPSPA
jgi:thiol-disulfide isomerase/thioredoxin